jgi:hypothetical protein
MNKKSRSSVEMADKSFRLGAILKEGRRFAADVGEDELKAWANDFIG